MFLLRLLCHLLLRFTYELCMAIITTTTTKPSLYLCVCVCLCSCCCLRKWCWRGSCNNEAAQSCKMSSNDAPRTPPQCMLTLSIFQLGQKLLPHPAPAPAPASVAAVAVSVFCFFCILIMHVLLVWRHQHIVWILSNKQQHSGPSYSPLSPRLSVLILCSVKRGECHEAAMMPSLNWIDCQTKRRLSFYLKSIPYTQSTVMTFSVFWLQGISKSARAASTG